MGNDAFSLKDKVALVTGSTMGIGEATARTLAQAVYARGDGLCSRCHTPPGGDP